MDIAGLFTCCGGRISRLEFWIGAAATGIVTSLLSLVADRLIAPASRADLVTAFVLLVMCYPLTAIFAKRLHDRGRPAISWIAGLLTPGILRRLAEFETASPHIAGWLSTALIVASAITSAWILIDLGILPGTPGPNAYGLPPQHLSN